MLAGRIAALDRMRGLVMVLMAVDHASSLFNGEAVHADSAWFGSLGAPLPAAGFLTRWASHLCAPTFVFLAGAALALSVERRLAAGASSRAIDRHLLARGLLIAGLEAWMAILWGPMLQVLYAIGLSLVCMVALRRLPACVLFVAAVAWIGLSEAVVAAVGLGPGDGQPAGPETDSIAGALLLVPAWYGGFLASFGADGLLVAYPLLQWLPAMTLGWVFGRFLGRTADEPEGHRKISRLLVASATVCAALFLAVRGANGYGNMWLTRTDGSLLRWLQASKYPPSLAFWALELGILAAVLRVFFAISRKGTTGASRDPLVVFGQSALFFYVLHIHLLALGGRLLGIGRKSLGLESAFLGALAVLGVLYPACLGFKAFKRRHPSGLAKYF